MWVLTLRARSRTLRPLWPEWLWRRTADEVALEAVAPSQRYGSEMSADQQRNAFLCAQVHATLATVPTEVARMAAIK